MLGDTIVALLVFSSARLVHGDLYPASLSAAFTVILVSVAILNFNGACKQMSLQFLVDKRVRLW